MQAIESASGRRTGWTRAPILLLGRRDAEMAAVADGLRGLGADVVESVPHAADRDVAPVANPKAVVVVAALEHARIGSVVRTLRGTFPDTSILVLCGPVSLATAFEAGKAGASAVLNLCASPAELLEALHAPEAAPHDRDVPSLSRLEWEYLSAVLADCSGNKSQAARRLGLRRWSLQRKLAKNPPPR